MPFAAAARRPTLPRVLWIGRSPSALDLRRAEGELPCRGASDAGEVSCCWCWPQARKFPLLPAFEREQRERPTPFPVAEWSPSCSGSEARDAGRAIRSPTAVGVRPAARGSLPRSREERSGRCRGRWLADVFVPSTASQRDPCCPSLNTQGSAMTTADSGRRYPDAGALRVTLPRQRFSPTPCVIS